MRSLARSSTASTAEPSSSTSPLRRPVERASRRASTSPTSSVSACSGRRRSRGSAPGEAFRRFASTRPSTFRTAPCSGSASRPSCGSARSRYALHDLLLGAEYSRWIAQAREQRPGARAADSRDQRARYGMASYRVNDWLHPGVYYSVYYPNVERRSGRRRRCSTTSQRRFASTSITTGS